MCFIASLLTWNIRAKNGRSFTYCTVGAPAAVRCHELRGGTLRTVRGSQISNDGQPASHRKMSLQAKP